MYIKFTPPFKRCPCTTSAFKGPRPPLKGPQHLHWFIRIGSLLALFICSGLFALVHLHVIAFKPLLRILQLGRASCTTAQSSLLFTTLGFGLPHRNFRRPFWRAGAFAHACSPPSSNEKLRYI